MNTFNFAFWNCALCPPKSDKEVSLEETQKAYEILLDIFTTQEVELIVICEINEKLFLALNDKFSNPEISSLLLNDKTDTGSRFDLACFYINRRIDVTPLIPQISKFSSARIKTGKGLLITESSFNTNILLVASHWPSKLYPDSEKLRNTAAQDLYRYVVNHINENTQVILMGDYNDHPFSSCINEDLRATNDRSLVFYDPKYWLYNPFWKSLTPRSSFYRTITEHDFGTCYSKSNTRSNWSSFDQIIFSGNFLTQGPWFLNEAKTDRIFSTETLKIIMDMKQRFDHFPIMGSIEFHHEVQHG